MMSYTVIPRFTRLLWQAKNRVIQNSRYTSPSIEKKMFLKNVKKISTKLMIYTIKPCYANFFGQGQKIV